MPQTPSVPAPFVRLILAAACLLLLSVTGSPRASVLEQQRQQFLDAKQALEDGRIADFRAEAEALRDYPLYPYLQYDYLRPRLVKAEPGEVIAFLEEFNDIPTTRFLRRSWLRLLAGRGQWDLFLEYYTPQRDTVLQCYQLLARMKHGGDERLLADIRRLWLVGESQPRQCDPAFDRLYTSDLMTPELIWERIGLTMQYGRTSLARYLARRLDAGQRSWLEKWIAVYHNPARGTRDPGYEDSELARRILAHGLKRLARRDVDTAIRHWEQLSGRYGFSEAQRQQVIYRLAMYAVIEGHDRARPLLDSLDDRIIEPEGVFQWRLRHALQTDDWASLVRWTAGPVPADEELLPRWQYWRARALEQQDAVERAQLLFGQLAAQRNYYGFMAADRLGREYRLNHTPLSEDADLWEAVSRLPGITRARELYRLDMTYQARREWHHEVDRLPPREQEVAALIAASWNWHDRTILTLGRAEAYDDLVLRFPLPYQALMTKYASMRDLDLSWIYALTRSESAFMVDARSPAGALGLMQVMPRTGHQTAHAIGFRTYHNWYLLQPDKNVTLGTAYLKQMYDRFNGNQVLATAAYNAGPHNVNRWLPDRGCTEPDIWIARIPFAETRKYVARVLFYASIYDWRLGHGVRPLKQRMAGIGPQSKGLLAGINCQTPQITQN